MEQRSFNGLWSLQTNWPMARNAIPLDLGDVINLRDLEQALENLNRLPSVESRIELSAADGPEAEPGQSDLIVHWKQSAPWRANLSFDDAGSKTTGKYQAGLTLAYDHLLGSRAKAEATAGPMEPVDTRFIIQCLWVTGFRTGSELFLVKSPPRPS